MTPKDSVELHNLPLVITLKLKKREDTGDLQNEISAYARKDAPATTQAAATPAQAAPTTPPWKR
jgi:hypothetical protein